MRKYIKLLKAINLNTVYFNFKYFPLRQALKLPVLVSRKVYLREVAGKIELACPVRHALVHIGFGDISIFDRKMSRSIWDVRGNVVIKGRAHIGHGSKISVDTNATLVLGDNFAISAESTIVAVTDIRFGDNCLLSWDILVMDSDLHKIKGGNGEIINHPQAIVVGDKVWIGCRSTILKGSKVPDNSVIGAGTVVGKDLQSPNSLYAGIPARHIRGDIDWEM